jgi:hypothetical protein
MVTRRPSAAAGLASCGGAGSGDAADGLGGLDGHRLQGAIEPECAADAVPACDVGVGRTSAEAASASRPVTCRRRRVHGGVPSMRRVRACSSRGSMRERR